MNLELFKETMQKERVLLPVSDEEVDNALKVLSFALDLGHAFGTTYNLFTMNVALDYERFKGYKHNRAINAIGKTARA